MRLGLLFFKPVQSSEGLAWGPGQHGRICVAMCVGPRATQQRTRIRRANSSVSPPSAKRGRSVDRDGGGLERAGGRSSRKEASGEPIKARPARLLARRLLAQIARRRRLGRGTPKQVRRACDRPRASRGASSGPRVVGGRSCWANSRAPALTPEAIGFSGAEGGERCEKLRRRKGGGARGKLQALRV